MMSVFSLPMQIFRIQLSHSCITQQWIVWQLVGMSQRNAEIWEEKWSWAWCLRISGRKFILVHLKSSNLAVLQAFDYFSLAPLNWRHVSPWECNVHWNDGRRFGSVDKQELKPLFEYILQEKFMIMNGFSPLLHNLQKLIYLGYSICVHCSSLNLWCWFSDCCTLEIQLYLPVVWNSFIKSSMLNPHLFRACRLLFVMSFTFFHFRWCWSVCNFAPWCCYEPCWW